MALVAQHADELRRQRLVEDLDHGLAVGLVARRDGALLDVLAGPLAQGLDVGEKRLVAHGVLRGLIDFWVGVTRYTTRASGGA